MIISSTNVYTIVLFYLPNMSSAGLQFGMSSMSVGVYFAFRLTFVLSFNQTIFSATYHLLVEESGNTESKLKLFRPR